MKKILRIFGFLLLGVIALAILGIAYIYFKGVPNYPHTLPDQLVNLKIEADSSRIARGAKIGTLLCNGCHINFKTGQLTGHYLTDVPKEFGKISSMNITQDKEYGIGSWTDGELYYFLRTGVRRDGHYNPIMGGYNNMADEDLYSIIAWLHSEHPSLAPSKDENPPNEFNLLVKFLCNTAFKPKTLPLQPITIPDSNNTIEFGRYLSDHLCECYSCHSADFKTMNTNTPSLSVGYYGGGNPVLNYEGQVVRSANITMDENTGIGKWTAEEFINAVKYCKKPTGGLLSYPMIPHTTLSDTEVRAIWEYLKTVPKINNPVERYKG